MATIIFIAKILKLFITTLFLITFMTSEIFPQMQREWIQRFNGAANSFDIASGMLNVPSGGVLVYGSSVGFGSLTDFALMRYSSEGNELWKATYNGEANQSDQISSAALSESSDIFVTGFITLNDNNSGYAVAKFLSNGSLSWVRIAEEPGYISGMGEAITVSSSGRIVSAGQLRNSSDEYKVILISYSSAGTLISKYILNSPGNSFSISMQPGDAGSVYLAYEKAVQNSGSDIAVAKFDSSLNLVWEMTFTGDAISSYDRPSEMKSDESGNVYICGSVINTVSSADYFTAKISASGNVIWEYEYDGQFTDISSSIAVDNSGNSYITGFSRSGAALGSEDIFTIKLNELGIHEWTSRYNGEVNGIDGGNTVAVDTSGNVYVGGYSDKGDVKVTYITLKIDRAGNLSWSDRYSLTIEPEDFIYSTVIDNENSVYVTGISLSDTTDYDIATIKYSNSVGIESTPITTPNSAELFQNFPNPFNPQTSIRYELRSVSFISIIISDVKGRQVASIVNSRQNSGSHEIEFAPEGLPSGIYFYTLYSDCIPVSSKSMVLLK